jgi:hypothetical protein
MLEELGNLKNMNELVHLIRILIATLCGYLIGYKGCDDLF